MKKAVPLKKLKEKLDYYFEMCIRYRDDFTCITCGKKFPIGERKELHAGHYIGRGNYSTRWDEENVNAQCRACNCRQSNNDAEIWHKYAQALELKYGSGTVERLLRKKHETFKLNRAWLEENIELYSEALKKYMNN